MEVDETGWRWIRTVLYTPENFVEKQTSYESAQNVYNVQLLLFLVSKIKKSSQRFDSRR